MILAGASSALPVATLLVTFPTVPRTTLAYAALGLLAVAWDVVYAGRIAQLRRAPRGLATLSGICGLLVAPAFIAHLAGSTLYGGRAVNSVAWVWPLTAILVLAQAAYATLRRYVTPLVGAPLLLYNVIVAAVATARYLIERGLEPPVAVVALSAAQASVLGTLLGAGALASPLAVLIPLLVPAYPARWRLTRAARALLSAGTSFLVGVTVLELPGAVAAVRSYQPYLAERLSERPAGDLALGMTILTEMAGPPPALTVRNDVPLLDSLEVDVVAVRLRPGGATLASLDSLAHVLEPTQRDSTRLVVSLAFDPGDAATRRRDPAAFDEQRLAMVERVARALRPDVILPAGAPYGEATTAAVGVLPVEAWRGFLDRAAARAHRVNRRIRVAVAAGDYGPADSALYVWAASRRSALDAVGFTVRPSFTGGTGVDSRLRAADRWMRVASAAEGAGRPKEHWIFDVRGYPVVHGDASQEGAVWHTIAWATTHPEVVGVVVSEPGDYTEMTGLRAADGRLRRTVGALRRALRGLRETVAP